MIHELLERVTGKYSRHPQAAYSPLLEELEKFVEEILKTKDRVLIAVVGSNATGKTHFGRYVRKNGLGRFHKKAVLIIDDRSMILDFLYFFKKRVKIPSKGDAHLDSFLTIVPDSKKIIMYINNTPCEKIEEADILLKLTTDEETRKKRLRQRYGNNPEKLKKYLDKKEVDNYNIKYTHELVGKV